MNYAQEAQNRTCSATLVHFSVTANVHVGAQFGHLLSSIAIIRARCSMWCLPGLKNRQCMLSLKSTLHLPDSKPILVLHHNSQLLTWACSLALASRACVAVHSATYCSCASVQLSQGEVILQLVEACREHMLKTGMVGAC